MRSDRIPVIGFPLEQAREILKSGGILSVKVILTQAPREKLAAEEGPCEYRVVRQKLENTVAELTVVKRVLPLWEQC